MSEDTSITPLKELYQNWFLDYASYVILDRAIPNIDDGLKPVQRRILHSLFEVDDGRFHKVANVIGNTMRYHPHGDASIGDALIQLAQKDCFIDKQGNFGDPVTGDKAAAARYIEARLSPLGREVVFNPKTTEWQMSYDGRNREPISLPIKFPLLLLQGAEGIAVGLSTKILPHNFNELIDNSIKILQGIEPEIYPDFFTGGLIDITEYKKGERGGRLKVRAKIEIKDSKTLTITETPFSTTTISLIESIVFANEKGKIKLKKIEDNTAANVEIILHLAPGISPDLTIDALYAFTQCEISISPNCCVIIEGKPRFMNVHEVLKTNTKRSKNLLKKELEIELAELLEKKFFSSLERIFIEEKIYRHIEAAENENHATDIIDYHITPFKETFIRPVTFEDYLKLLEIRIKRITKYDATRADDLMIKLNTRIEEIRHHLKHLIEYTIDYYRGVKEKFGKNRKRKTIIKTFDRVDATQVVLATEKLYVNRKDGFVGIGLKKDEFVGECSKLDDFIAIIGDGTFVVSKVSEKTFAEKNILHVAVFQKDDKRTTYNMIYENRESGKTYIKRFQVFGITRDKSYRLTCEGKNKVLYLSINPNGEAEKVMIHLKPMPNIRKMSWEVNFTDIPIKGRNSIGNIVSKYPIKKIQLSQKGASTLGKTTFYFDRKTGKLNDKENGVLLGEFLPDEKVLAVSKKGHYRIVTCESTHRLDEPWSIMEKFNPEKVYTAIYFDGEKKNYFLKRFCFEDIASTKIDRYISESPNSKTLLITGNKLPIFSVEILKGKNNIIDIEKVNAEEFIAVKKITALGNRVSTHTVKNITQVE